MLHLATQKRLEPVLHSLSEFDALIIYEQGVPADSTDAGRSSLVELVLTVWASAALELSSKRLATPHNGLRLYVAIRERSSTFAAGGMRDAINHLLRFAEILRNVVQPAKLVAHLVADDMTGAIQLLHGTGMLPYVESLSFLQQVALGDDALLRRVASTVATSVALQNKRMTIRNRQSFTTLLGGVFLLLPTFLDLKLHEFVESAPYPPLAEERIAPVLRYLLYLKCFGLLRAQWAEIAHDPLLLLLAGLEEAPSPEVLLHLSQSATVEMNDMCQQALLERLARYKHLEGRYLFAELVEGASDDPILLIRDMRYDSWVYASYLPVEAHSIWDILIRGLIVLQKAVDMGAEYLVLGPGFEKLTGLEEFYHLYKGPIQLVWTEPILLPGALSYQLAGAGGEEEDGYYPLDTSASLTARGTGHLCSLFEARQASIQGPGIPGSERASAATHQ